MFVGHYALGLATKQLAPRTSLGALIAAPILLDLLWPIFLLIGWEQVSIEQNPNPFLRLQFDSYPISHGLVAVIAWATLFASIYFGVARYLIGAITIWFSVVSHWLLDYVVHRPDLPLYAGGNRLLGLGLWNHPRITMALELVMFAAGIFIYQRATRAKNGVGNYGFWLFVLALAGLYAAVAFAPPPSSVKKLAIGTMFSWLFVAWAWWFDRNRESNYRTANHSERIQGSS
ncbi:MAG TPA: hypothetical protein VN696_06670 [Pyrinomonadaceae bacterium]|nr:hypothetical protein [Pyrinomonadaceae bacterium]